MDDAAEPITDFLAANVALAEAQHLDVETMWLLYRVECTGEDFYNAAADRVDDPKVAELLRRNGREELGHARRIQRAIARKTGEPAEPTGDRSLRFDVALPDHVSVKLLEFVLTAEQQGDSGYQGWADAEDDPEVQRLLRLNGREETIHADRVSEAIAILPRRGGVIRRRLLVSGRVQGVFFRASCAEEARRLGVVGFVANRRDGTVEVEAEGEPAAVESLVAWCRHGPDHARVDDVAVEERPTEGSVRFAVR